MAGVSLYHTPPEVLPATSNFNLSRHTIAGLHTTGGSSMTGTHPASSLTSSSPRVGFASEQQQQQQQQQQGALEPAGLRFPSEPQQRQQQQQGALVPGGLRFPSEPGASEQQQQQQQQHGALPPSSWPYALSTAGAYADLLPLGAYDAGRVDSWQLGVLAYQLLHHGHLPFFVEGSPRRTAQVCATPGWAEKKKGLSFFFLGGGGGWFS